MRVGEATVHYFVDLNAKIFGGRNFVREFLQRIQILIIVAGEHFPFDETIQVAEVADHAGFHVDLPADGDLDGVVVAVAVRIVAFAVG